MLIEEKSSGKECISVLDGFTLDREKLIGPQIYQFLLNAIVTVRLSPGIGLKEKEVIKRLGVSRTPIREALLRLEDEGLVQIFPQSGTYVSKIKIEAVLESQFIREALECSVARYAARNRNDELLESLSRKLEDYETALNDDEMKPHLTEAPWLIVVFAERYGKNADGSGSPSLVSSSGKENQCS